MNKDPCFRGCVEARAKLNLSLYVLDCRSDGLHELMSVMTTLSLADQLFIELHKTNCERDFGISKSRKSDRLPWQVNADAHSIPSGEGNICYRAAKLFFESLGVDPFSVRISIFIEKSIPDAAGLGGGSADAAAVLRYLFQNQHRFSDWLSCRVPQLTLRELELIALRCGADVPFCLYGGTRLCEGVGEMMTALPPLNPIAVLLATPSQFVQTKTAFHMLDRFRASNTNGACSLQCDEQMRNDMSFISSGAKACSPSHELTMWKEAIARQSVHALEPLVHNDFTPVISGALEKVGQLLNALRSTGAPVVSMSGSGPTCFALFDDLDKCENVYVTMSSRFPDVRFIQTTIDSTSESL